MSRRTTNGRIVRWHGAGVFMVGLLAAQPASASFHLAEISEVLTAYNLDSSAQFVELRMKAGGQNLVGGSKLAVFDNAGTFVEVALTVPSDVASGADRRWLIATLALEAVSGITPDFVFSSALLPDGMVCWGKPGADETNPANYVDCVSYGNYVGAPNVHTAAPTPVSPFGYSIQRIGDTNDSSKDFICGDPVNPENNAGQTANLAATSICVTPTSTTSTSTSTTTTTLDGAPVCGDGNADGNVTATDALVALATAVGLADCPLCRCDVDLSAAVSASDALRVLRASVGIGVVLECAAACN